LISTKKLERKYRGRMNPYHAFIWLRIFFKGLTARRIKWIVLHPL